MSNKSRTAVETAFRKLSNSQRANILSDWGFAGFDDLPDTVLAGVSNDIRDANPAAFGVMTAQATRPKPKADTASQLAGMADDIYARANASPAAEAAEGETEIDPHSQPATAIFEGRDAVIDPQAIFEKYNELSPRTRAARVKR